MKKIILGMICVCTTLSAAWEEQWVKAVQACQDKRYKEAEILFSGAISELQDDPKHAHVYIDRGRLYLLLDRDEEALRDIEKGLSYDLYGDDKLRAIVSKVVVLCRLGRHDEAEESRQILRTLQSSPQLEVYDDFVIIRNVPECECSKEMLRQYVADVFCDSINDVSCENGVCIGVRTKKAD